MTDYLGSQKVSLTGAQLSEILSDGAAAMESINSAGGNAPPVGVWDNRNVRRAMSRSKYTKSCAGTVTAEQVTGLAKYF